MEILKLAAKGKQNKEIGQELGMKLQTIKNQFSS
jgi:DNA-binding NarL/FixJ family response regulator